MKTLALIPARAGSKGIPGKNIKKLGDKPLIQYTIDAAKAIFPTEDIIVSTDGEEIKTVAENCGLSVPFLRPEHLASDKAGSYEVMLHALDFMSEKGKEYDILLLLQPTSPFRNSTHIKEALALYSSDLEMVVSVKESDENPYYTLFEENKDGFLTHSKKGEFTRRQDCPPVYAYNGAIYVINVKALRERPLGAFESVKKYIMSDVTSVDLDTPLDWDLAEIILKKYLF